jgi:hypothetical protein
LEILLGESFASICLTRSSNKELVVDGYDWVEEKSFILFLSKKH